MKPKSLILPEGTTVTVFTFLGNPWGLLAGWLVVINLLTFLIFGLDKWKARRKATHEATRRVPEKTLFLLSALGGSVGALAGMRVWRHKTLHKSFRCGIPAILALQLIVSLGLLVYFLFVR